MFSSVFNRNCYIAFGTVALAYVPIGYLAYKSKLTYSVGNNPAFVKFRKEYFLAYFLAMAGDWLQGPYLYKLYAHYGFLEAQIAVLYVCGFASTVIFGTWAPALTERFGRKKLCVACMIIYVIACLLTLSSLYGILALGRILGGIATSLLFSSFEAWYVHEHIDTHDFPKEWISVTFKIASLWNGVISVVCGIIANLFVGSMPGLAGPVWPFMLAVPCFMTSALIVLKQWNENYGHQKVNLRKSCMQGLREIAFNKRIFLMGAIQALFESVMYITVFLWTPVLDGMTRADAPLGIIFSTFMVCIMMGSSLFQILSAKNISVCFILAFAMLLAMLSNSLCVISTHKAVREVSLSFICLALFNTSAGIYFPAMNYLRDTIIPEIHKISIIGWFRVPLNFIACIVLMTLHNDNSRHGNNVIFIVCSILCCAALVCVASFRALLRKSEDVAELINRNDNQETLILV